MINGAYRRQVAKTTIMREAVFFLKVKPLKKSKYFRFGENILGWPKKNREIFGKFSEKWLEIKGQFVFEVRNTKKNRLRRAIMKENTIKLHQNRPNLAKIAPEGREKIWGRKYFRFLKTKKKHWSQRSVFLDFSDNLPPMVIVVCSSDKQEADV